MPGYRFCRTDDIALLADALNRCFVVHTPELLPLSVSDFKREIRELDIWCSSCMVVSADREPIGVITGAKRERESLTANQSTSLPRKANRDTSIAAIAPVKNAIINNCISIPRV